MNAVDETKSGVSRALTTRGHTDLLTGNKQSRKRKERSMKRSLVLHFVSILLAFSTSVIARAVPVTITVENLSPEDGLFMTPFWVGLHDGSFDVYDRDQPATQALERLAEDGDTDPISTLFKAVTGARGIDGTITSPGGFSGAPVLDPGESASIEFDVDASLQRYFSYASMIIPSNDAFIANGNQTAHELFDSTGAYQGPIQFAIFGDDVLDAGTEENDERNAAFFDQTVANAGTPTIGGVVTSHPGFIGSVGSASGASRLLGGQTAAGTVLDPTSGDFSRARTVLARITVRAVPEPSIAALFGVFLLGGVRACRGSSSNPAIELAGRGGC